MSPPIPDNPEDRYPRLGTVERNFSGRYIWKGDPQTILPKQQPSPAQLPVDAKAKDPDPHPVVPDNITLTVRLDVDGPYPLFMVSGTIVDAKDASLHWVARLERRFWDRGPVRKTGNALTGRSDRLRRGFDNLRSRNMTWVGRIDYKYPHEQEHLLPYGKVKVEILDVAEISDRPRITVTFLHGHTRGPSLTLIHDSSNFHDVLFEFDRTDDIPSDSIIKDLNTHGHPWRPSNLPEERISIQHIYERCGFDVRVRDNLDHPIDAWKSWTKRELHDAMLYYWDDKKMAGNRPREPESAWSMWVLFTNSLSSDDLPLADRLAATNCAGIMFDDIGKAHRQGAALFYGCPIYHPGKNVPHPDAWSDRQKFFYTVHETGHCFNLYHAWLKERKSFWKRIVSNSEARSFMNYPNKVDGAGAKFFHSFWYRFLDEELEFMRHAPEPMVQMGDFQRQGEDELRKKRPRVGASLKLTLGDPHKVLSREFLEPTIVDLTLENNSKDLRRVHEDILDNPQRLYVTIERPNGEIRRWLPFSRPLSPVLRIIRPEVPMQTSHFLSAGVGGWLIDEPGMYTVRAWLKLPDEIITALPLFVDVQPSTPELEHFAQEFFTDDVARYLAFHGSRTGVLDRAEEFLKELRDDLSESRAAMHANYALFRAHTSEHKVMKMEEPGDMGFTSEAQTYRFEKEEPDLELARYGFERVFKKHPENEIRDTFGNVLYTEQKAIIDRELEQYPEDKDAQDMREML